MNQIDTVTYHEYTIDELYFYQDRPCKRGTEMKLSCSGLLKRKYEQTRKRFIP